jgi:hypothetical protein
VLGFAVCALVYEEAIVKINKTATPTILGLTKTAASTVTVEGDAMAASKGPLPHTYGRGFTEMKTEM